MARRRRAFTQTAGTARGILICRPAKPLNFPSATMFPPSIKVARFVSNRTNKSNAGPAPRGVLWKQLAILVAVLDDVCAAAGIGMQTSEREAAASLVMNLYWRGYRNSDELKSAIEEAISEERFARGEPYD